MARANLLCSAMIYALLMVAISSNANADTLSTDYQGWRITIDDSPSQEFVAQALADLDELFPPYVPLPDWTLYSYVSNYGVSVETGEADDGDLPVFRHADDLVEETPNLRSIWSSMPCDGQVCSTLTQLNVVHGETAELIANLREAIDHDFDLVDDNSLGYIIVWNSDEPMYPGDVDIGPDSVPLGLDHNKWNRWNVEYGVYPVYVGDVGPQKLSPEVWSVTLSATPEPSTAILCLIVAATFGLLHRKTKQTSCDQ